MHFRRTLAGVAASLALALGAALPASAATWSGYTYSPQATYLSGGAAQGSANITTPCPNNPGVTYNLEIGLSQYVGGAWQNQPTQLMQVGPGLCQGGVPFAAAPSHCNSTTVTTWLVRARVVGPSGSGGAWDNGPGQNLACRH